MKKFYRNILLLGGMCILFNITCLAQDDTKTRSITSDDFVSQRPASNISKSKNKIIARQKTSSKTLKTNRVSYKYVAQEKSVIRRKPKNPRPNTSSAKSFPNKSAVRPAKIAEVGITMWRLREPRKTDYGPKLPVQINGVVSMWTPERVSTNTIFQKGDRVRLAIESSVTGYLYVIDRETYSDGKFGEPFLIFPASQDDDNSVRSGLLVDIPDQREDLPYFSINPKAINYTGELLTIIISPKPLVNLKIDQEGQIRNVDNLADLEENSDVEIFSRTDEQDKTYTVAESQSACGAKTRQLTREKSVEKPCGTQSRQLTREEPLPQSLYRIKAQAGQPAVAFIKLSVTQ